MIPPEHYRRSSDRRYKNDFASWVILLASGAVIGATVIVLGLPCPP